VVLRLQDWCAQGLQIRRLPCETWNLDDELCAAFHPGTRIVHYKGELRRALFGQRKPDPVEQPLLKIWQDIEHEPDDAPRMIRPGELADTMIRPDELETPSVRPLVSRRERRRPRAAAESAP
jgi:hypothetical protein